MVPTIEQTGAENSAGAALASSGHSPLRAIASIASHVAKERFTVFRIQKRVLNIAKFQATR